MALPAVARAQVPVVTIEATDPDASEVGPDPGTFTFTRTGDTSAGLTVNYTVGGSAVIGSDYINPGSSVTFAAGSTTATRTITPYNDANVEGPETVLLTLVDGASYDLGAQTSDTVTIADNTPPIVTIEATDSDASEVGPDPGTFTFTRVGDTTFGLTVNYTVGGSAVNGSDYINPGGSVTFAAGSTTATRTITPYNDANVEGPETVVLTLVDGASYDLGAQTSDTVTIADNAPPIVTIEATDPDASEVGPDPGTFTFTRVGDTSAGLAVNYTVGGSATSGSDYVAIGGNVTFAVGEATATRTITPYVDANAVEGSETVMLTLVDGANYDLGAADTATVTIADGPSPSTTTTSSSTTTSVTTTSSTTSSTSTSTTSTLPALCEPVSGKKLLLKAKTGSETRGISLQSGDPAITLGDGNGSADDPVLHGGTLRVLSVAGGFDDTYELPADGWGYKKKAGDNLGYKFGPKAPFKSISVKPSKQLKVAANGVGLGHTLETDPDVVEVVLTLGEHCHCMRFQGSAFKPGKKWLSKDAPAPAVCPLP